MLYTMLDGCCSHVANTHYRSCLMNCADDNSRVILTGASNDYINASHLKVMSLYCH